LKKKALNVDIGQILKNCPSLYEEMVFSIACGIGRRNCYISVSTLILELFDVYMHFLKLSRGYLVKNGEMVGAV
jgi:hypothetical protein